MSSISLTSADSFFLEESNGNLHIINMAVAKINPGKIAEGNRAILILDRITIKMELVESEIK